MVTYLLTFGIILILLLSAVLVHMFLGLNQSAKTGAVNEISREPELDDILFGK